MLGRPWPYPLHPVLCPPLMVKNPRDGPSSHPLGSPLPSQAGRREFSNSLLRRSHLPPTPMPAFGLPHILTGGKSFRKLNHTACLLSLHFPVPRGRERVPALSSLLPASPLGSLAGRLTGAPTDLGWCWELIKPTRGELLAHLSGLFPSVGGGGSPGRKSLRQELMVGAGRHPMA